MTALVWCPVQQRFVARHEKVRGTPAARSTLPAPMIISDSLPGVLNHADGKMYDSKSAYYAAVRAAGCEIIGNEKLTPSPPPDDPMDRKRDIATTIEQLEAGYRPEPATTGALL